MDGDRKMGAVAGGVKLPASMAPPTQKSKKKLSGKRLMLKPFDDVDKHRFSLTEMNFQTR